MVPSSFQKFSMVIMTVIDTYLLYTYRFVALRLGINVPKVDLVLGLFCVNQTRLTLYNPKNSMCPTDPKENKWAIGPGRFLS